MNVLAQVLVNQEQVFKTFKDYENRYYSLQSIGVTYRMINNWDKNDLLILNRRNNNAWRKFNWYEWGWVEVIQHLRSWGVALDKIQEIKKQLFSEKVEIQQESKHLFDLLLVLTALEQNHFYLRIYQDNTCIMLADDEYSAAADRSQAHITIPLEQIVHTLNSKTPLQLDVKELYQLTPRQATLIDKIRENAYEKIIFFYAGKPSISLDINKTENIENRTIELMKNTDYEKIYLFEQNGDIYNVEKTVTMS